MMLAQANVLPTVPWNTTGAVVLGLIAILIIVGSLLWVWNQFQEARERNSGKNRSVNIDPQPVSVSKTPKRYNHDLNEQRHSEVERRLTNHDHELEKLWAAHTHSENQIRAEVKTNREHNEKLFASQTEEIHHVENRLRDKLEAIGSKIVADVKNMMGVK